MALIDLVKAPLVQIPSLAVFVDGARQSNVISATVDYGFDTVSASASIVFGAPAAGNLGIGAAGSHLQVQMGYHGLFQQVFDGYVEYDGRRWFPYDMELHGSGWLKMSQFQYANSSPKVYHNQTDQFVVKDLLNTVAGIDASRLAIQGSSINLGSVQIDATSTVTTCTLDAAKAPWDLINEIDQCFGYKTFDVPSGQIVRQQILDIPQGAAAFAYAAADASLPIFSLDRPRSSSSIRNQINVTGYPVDATGTKIAWPVVALGANSLVSNPPKYVAFDFRSDLIESIAVAANNVIPVLGPVYNRVVDQITLEVPGNPYIQPGMTISVTDSKSPGSGLASAQNYFVQHVTHTFDDKGYVTRVIALGGTGGALIPSPIAAFTFAVYSEYAGSATTPAQPTGSTAGAGGTVAAGLYTYGISYVNANGETILSPTNTITTTGGTSTITINSPTNDPNATGWYAYVSQVNGAALTRQQAAGSPTAIGTPFPLTAPPTNSGAAPLTGSGGTSGAQTYDVLCDGSGSSDPIYSQDQLTYNWSNSLGVTATANKQFYSFQLTAAQIATHPTVTLTVSDPAGTTSVANTQTIDITLDSQAPQTFVLNVAANGQADSTSNGGQDWQTFVPATGHIISTPERADTSDFSLFGSDDGKLYMDTSNLAKAPVDVSGGSFGANAVNCIYINSDNPAVVLVGLANGQLWLAEDATSASPTWTWTLLFTFPAAVNWCVIASSSPYQMFVATGTQMLASVDIGATWTEGGGNGGDYIAGGTVERLAWFPVYENSFSGAGPSAPVPTTAAAGGTVAAGTYTLAYAYNNGSGTPGVTSGTAQVTTTGGTSTITVPTPGALVGSTTYSVYCSQAGGTSLTLQGTQTIGADFILTAPPTNVGAAPKSMAQKADSAGSPGISLALPVLNPGQASVKGLTHDAVNDVIYAGDDQARTYSSTSSAAFVQKGTLPGSPGVINHMVSDANPPLAPVVLFAAANKGVFKTVDDCGHWFNLRTYDGTTLQGLMIGYGTPMKPITPLTAAVNIVSGPLDLTVAAPAAPTAVIANDSAHINGTLFDPGTTISVYVCYQTSNGPTGSIGGNLFSGPVSALSQPTLLTQDNVSGDMVSVTSPSAATGAVGYIVFAIGTHSGAPRVAVACQTIGSSVFVESVSSTGWLLDQVKSLELWNGSSNNGQPSNWQDASFNDSAWDAIPRTPAGDLNNDLGFDFWGDGDLSQSQALCHNQSIANTNQLITLYRQKFTLAGLPSEAKLGLACVGNPGVATIWLNGQAIATVTQPPSLSQIVTLTTDQLIVGTNVIAVQFQSQHFGGLGERLNWSLRLTP